MSLTNYASHYWVLVTDYPHDGHFLAKMALTTVQSLAGQVFESRTEHENSVKTGPPQSNTTFASKKVPGTECYQRSCDDCSTIHLLRIHNREEMNHTNTRAPKLSSAKANGRIFRIGVTGYNLNSYRYHKGKCFLHFRWLVERLDSGPGGWYSRAHRSRLQTKRRGKTSDWDKETHLR